MPLLSRIPSKSTTSVPKTPQKRRRSLTAYAKIPRLGRSLAPPKSAFRILLDSASQKRQHAFCRPGHADGLRSQIPGPVPPNDNSLASQFATTDSLTSAPAAHRRDRHGRHSNPRTAQPAAVAGRRPADRKIAQILHLRFSVRRSQPAGFLGPQTQRPV